MPAVAPRILQLAHDPDPAAEELDRIFETRLAAEWAVMADDERAIRSGVHIELDEVGSELDRSSEGRERVLG